MIEKKMIEIKPFHTQRCLHIYLPYDYYLKTDKRYPVLYMFDGHNLYWDQDATYGHAWHIADQFDAHHTEMIVVGLECNHEGRERLHEFCPYVVKNSRLGDLDGRGQVLMQWMAGDLRAWVNQTYRTNGRSYLGGSSMGGLMSLYGIAAYSDIYQGAACLSSSVFLCLSQLQQEIRQASHLEGARIYMSYGSEEAGTKEQLAAIVKNHMDLSKRMTEKGSHVFFDMVIGGQHNEATWEKQVMDFVCYLGEANG